MFFDPERIIHMREMILAVNAAARRVALGKFLSYQHHDFEQLFEVMEGYPVTVRLLDPPLHEFLPTQSRDIENVDKALGVSAEVVKQRADDLHEMNPMLGHRGCRLAISYPEIYQMQARALFEAACDVVAKEGHLHPEIMIPLVADRKELARLKTLIKETAELVFKERGIKVTYLIGNMIELPCAALQAGAIAKESEFFSNGTNDLTQTTYGMSRDAAAGFFAGLP